LLFDNFKGQCTEKLLKLFDSIYENVVLIAANCTNRLQPLDLSVNKKGCHGVLMQMFPKVICSASLLAIGGKDAKAPIDLRLSIMKPLGAKW